MAECSKSQLIADACANGFMCLTPELIKAIELQLLCNLSQSSGGGGTGGVVTLAAGVGSGSGTFAVAFAAAPTSVVVSVRDSSGNQVLSATVVDITAAGFTFNLSGLTESANVSVHYVVIE